MPLLLVLLFLLIETAALGQRVPTPVRLNLAGTYNVLRRPLIDTRREGDSLRLYVRFPDANVLRQNEPLRVLVWDSYEAKIPSWQATVQAVSQRSRANAQQQPWAEFCVPVAALQTAQLLAIWPNQTFPDDPAAAAWLTLTPAVRARPFILTDTADQPLLRRYVRSDESFQIDCYGPDRAATLRRYPTNFTVALPPHTDPAMIPTGTPRLTALSVQELRPGQRVQLAEPGLYTLQVPEAPPLGLLAQPNAFPELTTATELIEPLRYLTTTAERERLLEAEVPKRAVDQFWLRTAADQQPVARQLIRTYYGRVADANRLFTAHKPGWMTDRGILYIVLGPPDRVERSNAAERWEYNDGRGGPYTFRPKPSTFATDYYELVRRPEQEWLWYRAVEQWRKGLTVPQGAAR